MINKKIFVGVILAAVTGIVLLGAVLAIWSCREVYREDENSTPERIAYDKSGRKSIVYISDSPNTFVTPVRNSSGIGQAHYPKLSLARMQSMDTKYTAKAVSGFSPGNGKYRIARINGPIDVTVYDAEGNEQASIIKDTPRPDSHVLAYCSKGEKKVYLPVYIDYVIKMTATDDGLMNYAVQEYDPYARGSSNHLVLFNDIEITEGQEYMAYIPSYSEEDLESRTREAADTDYTLFLGSTQILLSEELTGEEVFDAYCDVNVSADDPEKGWVFGNGSLCQYGIFTTVTALAYEGYELAGWYEGEDLVSTEVEYSFRVSKDIELVAVFKESSQEMTPEEIIAVTGIVLLGVVLAIWSCREVYREVQREGRKSTLEKISYDQSGIKSIVYIKENNEYIPYLVLESDYDGNVLLLRENVLPEEMQYKQHEELWAHDEYGSYYEESSIDEFLNTDFLKVFGPNVQAAIVNITIEVTDKASYAARNYATHMIERKVFLLSAVELGLEFSAGYNIIREGTPLKYFENAKSYVRRAYKANGEEWSYWTRTPWIWETYEVTIIGVMHELDAATADSIIGVRPAFCMGKDTVVREKSGIIAGERVYVLELESE